MTSLVRNTDKKGGYTPLFTQVSLFTVSICAFILSLRYPNEIKAGIIDGTKLALYGVIPAIFPFMILSDMITASKAFDNGIISYAISVVFGVPREASSSIILGNICGFPLGAKIITDRYRLGIISREDAERVIGIATNPSLAFVISGVGAGMLGSTKDGVLLYFSLILSTAITGALYRRKHISSRNIRLINGQKFNLSESTKSAAINSLYVGAFIVFFSYIINMLKALLSSELFVSLVSVILEITSATQELIDIFSNKLILLPLIAFALGFSGFSVHMQVSALINSEYSMRLYYTEKLTEGVIAAVICMIIIRITNC